MGGFMLSEMVDRVNPSNLVLAPMELSGDGSLVLPCEEVGGMRDEAFDISWRRSVLGPESIEEAVVDPQIG